MSKICPGVLSPPREILTPDQWRARVRARRERVCLEEHAYRDAPGDRPRRCASSRNEIRKAQRRTSLKATTKFCDQVDREHRIRPDHPVMVRLPIGRDPEMLDELSSAVVLYQAAPAADRREVPRRYYFGDFARKVVGVGSVGTEAFVLLMGERVGRGQRMIQAATDESPGSGSAVDKTIAQFSVGHAEQSEKDYQALVDAVATGRVQAVMALVTANPRPRLTGPLLLSARARPGRYHDQYDD